MGAIGIGYYLLTGYAHKLEEAITFIQLIGKYNRVKKNFVSPIKERLLLDENLLVSFYSSALVNYYE